ncbi:MAG: hypothetical protein GF381_01330 [Candidatus Pacebacteria bacterium]|nr:hypothetical protein [Candidatus Paceibacterota bacterium]
MPAQAANPTSQNNQSSQSNGQVTRADQANINSPSSDQTSLSPSNSLSPPNNQNTFSSSNPLLNSLVSQNLIGADQAQQLNNQALTEGRSIEDLLLEKNLVTEEQLAKTKAQLNNIPFIRLSETGTATDALRQIDESVARKYQVLPFGIDRTSNTLKLAMADPLDVAALNFIRQKTGLSIQEHYALPSEIKRLIAERYAQDLSSDVSRALEETSLDQAQQKKAQQLAQIQGGLVRAAPINKIVNTILDYAIQSRASDVHIEPQVEKTRVRYRIDGILMEKLILPKKVHDAVVSRIKILADLKIDEKRVPQDGRFDYSSTSSEIDLRVSTVPTIHGEKVVMRLLKKDSAVPSLEGLGLRGRALKNVEKAIRIPHGIILVTGPTGSGKTTTLYSVLHQINTPKVNIMTLEDPVEYQMNGITQVQVNRQAGLTFANGLRSFLRQDPDIIMVGEIRDSETAELAVQASLTGHLVFSTLHTNSAAGAIPRLIDMEVEPFLLSSSVILVVGQRVVRRINPDYKEEYQPDQAVIEDIKNVLGEHFNTWCTQNNKDPNNITLFRPSSNRPQTELEYKGRVGIFEVMDITDKIKELINQAKSADVLEDQSRQQGMLLMKQDGYLKALEGITTIEEVLRVAEVK